MGHEAPDSVYMSQDQFDKFMEQLSQSHNVHTGNVSSYGGKVRFYSTYGIHEVIEDPKLPKDCVHMNRLTVSDILIDDILLDDADFDIFDD